MSLCLNPACAAPNNPDSYRFCQNCGWRLRLGDRFEAVRPLAKSINSQTWLGRDCTRLAQSQCLIKGFTARGQTEWERQAATERLHKDLERWAIASRHPQLPTLIATYERAPHTFAVQPFIVGTPLSQTLQEKAGPWNSAEVREFLADVLPVVHHLHVHQVVHRDIKPQNFRRPPDSAHWWLVDWGSAKPLTATRMAQPGTLVGSADYAAPEQLRGEATFASDIYSLGVVCLHLLTGLPPFDLFDSAHGLWRWQSIVPDVDPQLASVLDTMVQPALRDRFPTVAAVMSALTLPMPPKAASPKTPSDGTSPWPVESTVELGEGAIALALLPTCPALAILTPAGTVTVRSLSPHHPVQATLTSGIKQPSLLAGHPQTGQIIVANRQGHWEAWNTVADQWQRTAQGSTATGLTTLRFTPDGAWLVGGTETGDWMQWPATLQNAQVTPSDHSGGITCLAVNGAGTLLALGDRTGQVSVWNVASRESLRVFSRRGGAISAIAWLPQDDALVIASWDMSLHWRCPQTGGLLQAARAGTFSLPVRSLVPHPSAPLVVSTSQDGRVQVWSWEEHQAQDTGTVIALPMASSIPGIPFVDSAIATTGDLPTVISLTETGQVAVRSLPVPPTS